MCYDLVQKYSYPYFWFRCPRTSNQVAVIKSKSGFYSLDIIRLALWNLVFYEIDIKTVLYHVFPGNT